jgi:hypothetical protein
MIGQFLTLNSPKSIAVALIAIIMALAPCGWNLFKAFVEAELTHATLAAIMTRCLEDWLLGTMAVGIAASVNWVESKIDFDLDSYADLLSYLAMIGSVLSMIFYVGVTKNIADLEKYADHFIRLIGFTYISGATLVLIAFASIIQCRRAKDLTIAVER